MTEAPPSAPTTRRPAGPLAVVYRAVLTVFLLAGAVQIFLAGWGAFRHGFGAHELLGFGMGGLSVVILLLAVLARVGTRDVVLAVVRVALTGGAQSALASAGGKVAFWGGLHALDGLVVLGIAGFLHAAAIRRGRATAA